MRIQPVVYGGPRSQLVRAYYSLFCAAGTEWVASGKCLIQIIAGHSVQVCLAVINESTGRW